MGVETKGGGAGGAPGGACGAWRGGRGRPPRGPLPDPRLVDLELRSLDADHGPPVAERGAQLVLRDPLRPPGPGLTVAEADQVAAAARAQHRRQAGHVSGPVLVVEYVEHAAVDDRVE